MKSIISKRQLGTLRNLVNKHIAERSPRVVQNFRIFFSGWSEKCTDSYFDPGVQPMRSLVLVVEKNLVGIDAQIPLLYATRMRPRRR